MKFSYTPLKECQSFWTWLWWSWSYPNPQKLYPAKLYCWRFFGITKDIDRDENKGTLALKEKLNAAQRG